MVLALSSKGASIRRWWRTSGLAGPIFAKELRVASRRRRSYALRCAYVLLLTAYVAAIWLTAVVFPHSMAVSRAQMQVAANTITRGIVWFQFFGAQAVVLLLMSTAISEEVYCRTLGVLVTTPLSSRQVVMNKFFSRLSQILLLVAASLPLLAIVRVLGGIAWGYLIISLCLTAATVVFVGAVSLFFSALCRRAHIAVTLSVLSLAFVFLVVPFLLNSPLVPSRRGTPTLAALNPYLLLLSRPNTPPGAPGTPMAGPILGIAGTIVCCVVLVLAARVLLAGATGLVSRVALPRAMGEPVLLDRLRRGRWRSGTKPHSPQAPRAGIRRVTGPPMIWKEMVCTLSGSQKFVSRMVIGVEAALVLLAYLFPALTAIVDYGFLHVVCVFAFFGLGVLLTIMSSATVISIEREARTWPLLLLTPLTDREILVGKVVGVLRRCGPAWLMLLAYIAAFAYGGCYRPLAVVQVTLLVLSVVLFLTATGFYFGSRFSRTSEAVTANLIFVGVLWCIPPLLDLAVPSGSRAFTLTMVPFSQAFAMIITTLVGSESRVRWFTGSVDAAGLVGVMFMSMMGYLVLSLAFAWMAVRRLRRRLP